MISTTQVTPSDYLPFSCGITTLPLADGRLLVRDYMGAFLCVTDDLKLVMQLLIAELDPFPDGHVKRPHYRTGAREIIFPGQALEREAALLERHAAQRLAHENAKANASGNLSLESLGLL